MHRLSSSIQLSLITFYFFLDFRFWFLCLLLRIFNSCNSVHSDIVVNILVLHILFNAINFLSPLSINNRVFFLLFNNVFQVLISTGLKLAHHCFFVFLCFLISFLWAFGNYSTNSLSCTIQFSICCIHFLNHLFLVVDLVES